MRYLIYSFVLIAYSTLFGQSSPYSILTLGPNAEKVTIDTSYHWYIQQSEIDSGHYVSSNTGKSYFRRSKFVEVLPNQLCWIRKDEKWNLSLDSSFKHEGNILIGRKDTMLHHYAATNEKEDSWLLSPGTNVQINVQPAFRDESPFVDLFVAGTYPKSLYTQNEEDYELYISCFFTVFGYYKASYPEPGKSFMQSLSKDISLALKNIGVANKNPRPYLMLIGYIDDDAYRDFVLLVGDHFIIFTTEDAYIAKKRFAKISHIQKDLRDREF